MPLKSLRSKSIKKRSLSFLLGSPKTSNLEFKRAKRGHRDGIPEGDEGTEAILQTLIERQELSAEDETEVRNACSLLYHSVEQEEMLMGVYDWEPESECEAGIAWPRNSNAGTGGQSGRTQPVGNGGRFYQRNSGSTSERSSADGLVKQRASSTFSYPWSRARDMDSMSQETCVESHSSELGLRHFGKPQRAYGHGGVYSSINVAGGHGRVPSFDPPPSTRLNRKPSVEDLQASREESKRNSMNADDLLIASAQAQNQGESTIVDNKGIMQVLSAVEETQRYLDLQRAVMEKMRTGLIRSDSRTSFELGDDWMSDDERSRPVETISQHEETETWRPECPPPKTRPRLLQRLSIFGIGRRKSLGRNREVGLSRMVAV